MKHLLLITLLFLMISANAQDTTWNASMAKLYGSKAEKLYQHKIEVQSDSHFLCRFIGFKQFYANDLTVFLQARRGFNVDDSPEKAGYDIYVLTKRGVYLGNKPKKLIISFAINKDMRITSGKITGPFAYLADLFLTYWPQDPLFAVEQQLKPGTAAVKHCYGDLISFKWNGAIPYITITKDPNMTVPVPQLTASN